MAPKRIKKIGGDVAPKEPGHSEKKISKSFKGKLKVVSKSNMEPIAPETIKKKDSNNANSAAEFVQPDKKELEPTEVSKSNMEPVAPETIKKKDSNNANSGAELVQPDKKEPEPTEVSKSNMEPVAPETIKKKDSNNANSGAELVQPDKKELEPTEVSKSSSQELVRSKESRTACEVKIEKENKRKRNEEGKQGKRPAAKHTNSHQRNKGKKIVGERQGERKVKIELGRSKESGTASEVKTENENKRKRNEEENQDINGKRPAVKHTNLHQRNKGKKIVGERRGERKVMEQKFGKSIGGVIFMCNAKTKPDCFRYHVMGVSASRQDIVMRIRPGLKLFLYDFDLRLMYGIFEASSVGGMKLEPAAFAGGFPAQVRFNIYKDCLALPESIFKKAIQDSYDEKTHKFKTELTMEQVNRLTELFHPVPLLNSTAKSSLPELGPAPIVPLPYSLPSDEILRQPQVQREQYGSNLQQGSAPVDHNGHFIMHGGGHSQHPLFLTEKEYRSYGLRSEKQLLSTTASNSAPTTHIYEKYSFDYRGEQLQDNAPRVPKESGFPSLLFPNEKEYRAFGLKGFQELPSRQAPPGREPWRSFQDLSMDTFNPYDDSTDSLVNRYLMLPGPVATTTEPHYLTGKGAYVNGSRYISEPKDYSMRLNPETERSHGSYSSYAFPDSISRRHHLGGTPNLASSSVSSRFSFPVPSLPRH